jgi:hypothetical protein
MIAKILILKPLHLKAPYALKFCGIAFSVTEIVFFNCIALGTSIFPYCFVHQITEASYGDTARVKKTDN